MRLSSIIGLCGLAVGGATWAIYSLDGLTHLFPARTVLSSGRAGDAPMREVGALGWVEPAGGVIDVGTLAGQRVERLSVEEGDRVEEGAVLGLLDAHALREQEVEVARAQLIEGTARGEAERRAAAARTHGAAVAREQAGADDHQIAAQEKQIQLMERNLELARKDFSRTEALPSRVVAAQEKERQELAVKKAEAELDSARASLGHLLQAVKFRRETADAQYEVAASGEAQVVAASDVSVLKRQLALAELNRDRTRIVAPTAGTVLKIHTRQGESITSAPILQVADLDRMICIAEVDESDVHHVRKGQEVRVAAAAFQAASGEADQRLRGTVESVGMMIHAPRKRGLDPLSPTDRHVFEVRIALDGESSRRASRFVNMQVDVRIAVGGEE